MKRTPYAHIFVLIAFLVNTFGPVPLAQAQEFHLPAPGVMVHLSPPLDPPMLKGIKVHPKNPFQFDFILDKGSGVIASEAKQSQQEQLKIEATRLIKYFLASLTIPENDLWVNLSPYEKNRIIPQSFGQTEMGRDLLAEDYMLKQITASLIYPEEATGKKFWKRIYEEAAKKFGTTNIPVNTFNKVWIVPEKAVVYENVKAGTAYVVEAKLKVMLEQDYLALSHNVIPAKAGILNKNNINALGSQIVREIVIPELTKEVNEDKNFAQLRQVYNSLILATWYKKKIKDSILAQIYDDKNKIQGLVIPAKAGIQNKNDVQFIYQRYLQAFKKGVFNYIKEDQDPMTQETIPRKYFSGGWSAKDLAQIVSLETIHEINPDQLGHGDLEVISSRFDPAMNVKGRLKYYWDRLEGEDTGKNYLEDVRGMISDFSGYVKHMPTDDIDRAREGVFYNLRNARRALYSIQTNFYRQVREKQETTKTNQAVTILPGSADQFRIYLYFNSKSLLPNQVKALNQLIEELEKISYNTMSNEEKRVLFTRISRANNILPKDFVNWISNTVKPWLRTNRIVVIRAHNAGYLGKINKSQMMAVNLVEAGGRNQAMAVNLEAQREIVKLFEKANGIYQERNGPFVIQQYIPLGYIEPGSGKHVENDIHGGEALWLLLRDLVNLPMFRGDFPKIGEGEYAPTRLINLFDEYDRKFPVGDKRRLFDAGEKEKIEEYKNDVDNLLIPYLKEGKNGISYQDIRTKLGSDVDVKGFYEDYYDKTQYIYGVLTKVFGKILDLTLPAVYDDSNSQELSNGFVVRTLERGFYIDDKKEFHFKVQGDVDNVLVIDYPNENIRGKNIDDVFKANPELLIKVFQWAAESHAIISDSLLRSIAGYTSGLPEVTDLMQAEFLELLKSPEKISLILLKMYETGLLGKFFPEFEGLKYHFEVPSHRFSVPIHTLYLLYSLEYPDPSNENGNIPMIYGSLVKSSDKKYLAILRLAILLHDLQKQDDRQDNTEPHPIGGALKITPKTLSRFIVSQDFRSKVQWLVWHHQELGARAGTKLYYSDLVDILDLGRGTLDKAPPLWNIFYLLSVADANSVDPYTGSLANAKMGDKIKTMSGMFEEMSKYFSAATGPGREKILQRWRIKSQFQSEEIRHNKKQALLKSYPGDGPLIEEYLGIVSPYYLRMTGISNLNAQFKMFKQVVAEHSGPLLQAHSIVMTSNTSQGPMFEVLVGINHDAPGVLFKISGVLAALGFNIWDAQISTTKEGVVFDQFRGYFLSVKQDHKYWEQLTGFLKNKIIRSAIHGPMDLQSMEFKPFANLEVDSILGRNEVLPALIKLVLGGHVTVDDVFNFNRSFNSFIRPTILGHQTTRISFEDQKEGTVLNLETDDRPGLLYMVSRILSEGFGLTIKEAPISTVQIGPVDKFLLTTQGRLLNADEKEIVAGFLENFLDQLSISNDEINAAVKKAKATSFTRNSNSARMGGGEQLSEDQAMASFRAFDRLKDKLRLNKRFFEGEGYVVAFDMDEASEIEPDQQESKLGISNSILLDIFPKLSIEVFSTVRTSLFQYKEEGYIYIPNNISQKELRNGLQDLSVRLKSQIGKTLSFAAIKAVDLGKYISTNSLDEVEILLANKLREAKGDEDKKGTKEYGNGIVFVDLENISQAMIADLASRMVYDPFEETLKVDGKTLEKTEHQGNNNIVFNYGDNMVIRVYSKPGVDLSHVVAIFDRLSNKDGEKDRKRVSPSVRAFGVINHHYFIVVDKIIEETPRQLNEMSMAYQNMEIDLIKYLLEKKEFVLDFFRRQTKIGYDANDPEKRVQAWLLDVDNVIKVRTLTRAAMAEHYYEVMTEGEKLRAPLVADYLRSVKDGKEKANPAQITETGGIDLTPAHMNVQTQNEGGGIKFHLDPAMLAQLRNAPGFVPVIISIEPLEDLRGFLGLQNDNIPHTSAAV